MNGRRVAVVGVGQLLRGDDAAGVVVARRLRRRPLPASWLVLDAGPAPESCTGPLRAFRPDLVVFVDAAEMGAQPGALGWHDPRHADGGGTSTHSLPLGIVAGYVAAELGCEVRLLGIQPGGDEIGAAFTPAVRRAVGAAVSLLSREAAGAGLRPTA